jgi:AMP nucleosidase
MGHELMNDPNSEYIAFVEPGNVVTRRKGLPPKRLTRSVRAAASAADARLPPASS